ncbi:NAD(P)-binding protein [Byssothecium circinans]|uniref:NAD(P)-binding protein n=1 Tax=Byssothecium circinans TaxID=147558 RepID=A0A6A5UAI3_9PLEO|nr:NAD(P)-binding protein [Byssothecium circinans]
MAPAPETVLVIGATGNIGTSAIQGALKAGYKVLAIVRNLDSAEKLFKNIGTKEGVTTVEADIISDIGVQSVVDQVKAGKLPQFQHVYSCVGQPYGMMCLTEIDNETLEHHMSINFAPNFYAYRATVPYLLDLAHPTSTWTLCTGAQGDMGVFPAPAMTQGALFSMANAAARELEKTNVRFNEVYLAFRVEIDAEAEKHGAVKSSQFGNVYAMLLGKSDIRSERVLVIEEGDMTTLRTGGMGWRGESLGGVKKWAPE